MEKNGTALLWIILILGTSLAGGTRRMLTQDRFDNSLLRLRRQANTAAPQTTAQLAETTEDQQLPEEETEIPNQSYENIITPFFAGGYRPNSNPEPSVTDIIHGRIGGGGGVTTQRPATRRQPSPCVWAIVTCCAAGSTYIHNSCFEQLGCEGAWWDNPCDYNISAAALSSVLNFYQEGLF